MQRGGQPDRKVTSSAPTSASVGAGAKWASDFSGSSFISPTGIEVSVLAASSANPNASNSNMLCSLISKMGHKLVL
jgi:hypothetical protein